MREPKRLASHQLWCSNHQLAFVEMPRSNKNRLNCQRFAAQEFVAFVICFEIESLIQPVIGCVNLDEVSNVTEIHRPCGFCTLGSEQGNPELYGEIARLYVKICKWSV